MRLVGRDDELAVILDATVKAQRRDLVAILLTGEAGIGKSMLARTAVSEIESAGWTVVRVGGDALEQSIPYAALARVVAPLAAELAAALDVLGGRAPAQLEASFGQVCGGLTALLRDLLDAGPLALAIDDVDVLDDDTLAALALVMRRLRNEPVALIGTSRTAAVAGASRFGTFVDVLDSEGALLRMPLSAFDEPTIGLVVAEVLAAQPDADLVREMHRRTDGNPFFAVEIASSLRDAGQVDADAEHGARLTSPMRLSRTDAVLRRFAPLEATGRAVLEAVAVLGRAGPSDLPLIAEVTALPAPEVAAAFDDLVAGHVLAAADHDDYVFAHDLVREAVYDAIGPARQRLLHAAIASHLAAAHAAGRPADALLLARHVSASALPGDAAAARVLAEAGHLSRDIAPGSAAALYVRALELAPSDDATRPSLLASQCRALALASRPHEATVTGRAALDQLDPGSERTRTANVVIGALVELGRLDDAIVVADDAVAADPASPVLAAQRASVLWNLKRFDESFAEAARADALPAASDAERLLTLGPLGLLSAYAGIPRALPDHTAEMLRLGAGLPHTLELYSTAIASYSLATSGYLSLARTPLSRAEALVEDLGGTAFRAQVLAARVFVDWLEGRWDEAMDAIERVALDRQDAQLAVQEAGLQAIEIDIRSWRGEVLHEALLDHAAPVPNFGDLRVWAIAGRLLAAGRIAEARPLLTEADGRNAFEIAYRPMLLARRIEVELADDAHDTAETLLVELDADPQRRNNQWASTVFLRCAAQVRNDAGLAEQSAELAGEEGLVFEQARSQLVAAELAADAAGGLDAAYRVFQALGADALRRRAAAVLKDRGLKVPRQRATADGPLSAAELKLARLVQQGMRNREIAAVLHLSPRTVEVYLSRIYGKLNVSSRLELARVLDSTALDG